VNSGQSLGSNSLAFVSGILKVSQISHVNGISVRGKCEARLSRFSFPWQICHARADRRERFFCPQLDTDCPSTESFLAIYSTTVSPVQETVQNPLVVPVYLIIAV